ALTNWAVDLAAGGAAVDEAVAVFDPRTRAVIFESAGDSVRPTQLSVGGQDRNHDAGASRAYRSPIKRIVAPGAGMSLMELNERHNNPVDEVERLAAMHDWSFDRAGNDEISISVQGRWTDYHVSFTWMDEIEALHLACAFDLKVPEPRRGELLAL